MGKGVFWRKRSSLEADQSGHIVYSMEEGTLGRNEEKARQE